jgi:hypothetical protein
MVVTNNTEEDGRKIKNIYNEKNCNFCLNLMVKIGETYFYCIFCKNAVEAIILTIHT